MKRRKFLRGCLFGAPLLGAAAVIGTYANSIPVRNISNANFKKGYPLFGLSNDNEMIFAVDYDGRIYSKEH